MVPLGGRPILEYTVRWLRKHGVRDLVVNLHHCADTIRDHFGDGSAFGVGITYSYEPQLLGTAGAIRACANLFKEGPFLIIYGDNLTTCDLGRLVAFHRDRGALASIALFWRDDVTQSGMVDLDSDDRIRCFVEKPSASEVSSHWVNAGIIVAEPGLLTYVPEKGFSDLGRDVLPAALATGETLSGYRMSEGLWWVDSLEDYRRLVRLVAEGKLVL
jgi:NDP-sugar pyrophosphorylase family protein